jgi:hypothetical protein
MIVDPLNIGYNAGEALLIDDATRAVLFTDIAELGCRLVRFGGNWVKFEAKKGVYNYSVYDGAVNDALAAGLEPVFLIGPHPPSWKPVAADYARLATNLVKSYGVGGDRIDPGNAGRGVRLWELWNEQNLGAFWPGFKANAADYTSYLKAAYPVIKELQPGGESVVALGGLAWMPSAAGITFAPTIFGIPWFVVYRNIGPVEFLTAVYANGGGGLFDAVAYHPYASTDKFGIDEVAPTQKQIAKSELLWQVMDSNGDGDKPIWWTEFGRDTARDTEAGQMEALAAQYEIAKNDPHVERITFYSFRDWTFPNRVYDPDDKEQNYGIIRGDFSHKLAYGWAETMLPNEPG